MASKVSLKRHQKHANYGPFIDIPVVYMHPCSWSAVFSSVRKIFFSQYVSSQLPLPPFRPWHRFYNSITCILYDHLPAGSAGMMGFLGHVITITCTAVQSQENMNKQLGNAVFHESVVNVQLCVQICTDKKKVSNNLLQTLILSPT